MPTTPNYAIPYPALSDPPHGPNQMAALATAVDTVIAGNTVLDVASTAVITAPYTGQLVCDQSDLMLKRWTGSAWVPSLPVGAVVTAEFRQTGGPDQSITNATDTKVSFGTTIESSPFVTRVVSGTGHYFDLGLAGRWTIKSNIRMAAGGSDAERAIAIANEVAATGVSRFDANNQYTAGVAGLSAFVTKKFPVNQRIAVWAYQTSGGTRTLDNGLMDNRIQFMWHGE